MHALPAAPAPAPSRQLFVGTAVACAAGATMFGGMIALYFRFRQAALSVAESEWKPAASKVPEVATNNMLIAFLGVAFGPLQTLGSLAAVAGGSGIAIAVRRAGAAAPTATP